MSGPVTPVTRVSRTLADRPPRRSSATARSPAASQWRTVPGSVRRGTPARRMPPSSAVSRPRRERPPPPPVGEAGVTRPRDCRTSVLDRMCGSLLCDAILGGSKLATIKAGVVGASSLAAAKPLLPLVSTHLIVPGDRRAVTASSQPAKTQHVRAYRKPKVSSGSKAAASTHELGLDALWGPAQDCTDLSCREFGSHANRMMPSPAGWPFVVVRARRLPWRPGMAARPVAQRLISNGQRPDGRWPGKGAGRPRWRPTLPDSGRPAAEGRRCPPAFRSWRLRSRRRAGREQHLLHRHLAADFRQVTAKRGRYRSSRPAPWSSPGPAERPRPRPSGSGGRSAPTSRLVLQHDPPHRRRLVVLPTEVGRLSGNLRRPPLWLKFGYAR